MIVHLGVIIIAVAIVASNSYTHSSRFVLEQGKPISYRGHTFELLEMVKSLKRRAASGSGPRSELTAARLTRRRSPTTSTFGQNMPTPSVRSGLTNDIYLTLEPGANVGDSTAAVKIFIKPLIVWLWFGSALMGLGTVLAAFPGKRRRMPTDPTSAPIPNLEVSGV